MTITRLSIPFAKLDDNYKITEEGKAKANSEVSFESFSMVSSYTDPLDWFYQCLGESANLEWMFGASLLEEVEDEVELEDHVQETFTHALIRLSKVFESFNTRLKNITLQVDPKSDLERLKALRQLESGIHEFTGKLSQHMNSAGLVDDEFRNAFEKAVSLEKKYIAERLAIQVPTQSEVHAKMQQKLKYLHFEVRGVFEEIKAQRLTAQQLLNASEVKAKQKQANRIVTKELLERQLNYLPDLFNEFYLKIAVQKAVPAQHKSIAEMQLKLKRFTETYAGLNFSEPASEKFCDLMILAMSAEAVFMNDLVQYGNYTSDIQRLLIDTRSLVGDTFKKILRDRNIQYVQDAVQPQTHLTRREYGVYSYTTQALHGTLPEASATSSYLAM